MASSGDILLLLSVEEYILSAIIIAIMVVVVILMDYLMAVNSIVAGRMTTIKSCLEFFAAWLAAEQRSIIRKML